MKNFLKEIKQVKNIIQKDYISLLKHVGQNLVKPQHLNNRLNILSIYILIFTYLICLD